MLLIPAFNGWWIINILELLVVVVGVVCFTLYYLFHSNEAVYVFGVKQLPTISLTGGFDPQEVILTAGLHLFAFFGFVFFFIIYHDVDNKLIADADVIEHVRNPMLCQYVRTKACYKLWNGITLSLGLLFSVFLFLTGSCPITLNFILHSIFAIIMFIMGALHIIVFTLCFYPLMSQRQRGFTLTSSALIVILNLALLISGALTLLLCDTTSCKGYAAQSLVITEYITAVCLVIYIEAFRFVVDNVHIGVIAVERRSASDAGSLEQYNIN